MEQRAQFQYGPSIMSIAYYLREVLLQGIVPRDAGSQSALARFNCDRIYGSDGLYGMFKGVSVMFLGLL